VNSLQDDSANLTARARHAILWVGSTTIIWQVLSWALTLLTARILLPKDYGILSLTETVAPFLGMLAALNLSTWIVQADRFGDSEKASMYSLTSIVGVGMAAVGVALGPLIGAFFENPEMVRPFQVVALTFAVRGTAVVPIASLQRALNFKPIALMNLVVGVSSGILQLGLAWLGYGYWALIAGIVYRELASAIWAHAYVGLQRKFTWDMSLYR
jgi:O-antigen/teichoic acid export membrane protein